MKKLGLQNFKFLALMATLSLFVAACSSSKTVAPGTPSPASTPTTTTLITPTGSALAVNTSSLTIAPSANFTFTASGGTAPYAFYMISGGGSIDQNSGLYVAPSAEGTAGIRVVDAANAVVYASIIISNSASPNPSPSSTIAIYRANHSSLKDHLYGITEGEGAVFGYVNEGLAFKIFSTPGGSGAALFRCRTTTNPQRHFLSTNALCEGLIYEGGLGYIATSSSAGLSPLYRFVSDDGKDHLVTTNYNEGVVAKYQFEYLLGYVYGP